MTSIKEVMERDNAALMDSESSEVVTYRRPSTDVSRQIPVIMERGNLYRGKDIRDFDAASRALGTVFLWADLLTAFSGGPQYQDTITDAAGEKWTVMEEVARDAGLVEASIERDMRPGF